MAARQFVKQLVPPIAWKLVSRLFGKNNAMWSGDFPNWQSAAAQCTGYDENSIVEKCRNALLQVKNGKRIYERDSVLFDCIEYSWPLAAILLKSEQEKNNSLRVLDFGGSLGSSYYQNRGLFGECISIQWGIVEQQHFVAEGKKYFEDQSLRFFFTPEECVTAIDPQVLLLSSVLQYLPEPYIWLERLASLGIPYLVLDRTAFSGDQNDLLTIQDVPEEIYKARYPCWFLSMPKAEEILNRHYTRIATFDSFCENDVAINNGRNLCQWRGMIWEKK